MEMHHPEVDGWLFLCFPRLLFFRPLLPCSSTIRDHDAISSTLRRYIMHASWMLNLPVSMAANTMAFLLATQRTVSGDGRVISALGNFRVEVLVLSSACLDTMLLCDIRWAVSKVSQEAFATINPYHLRGNRTLSGAPCKTAQLERVLLDYEIPESPSDGMSAKRVRWFVLYMQERTRVDRAEPPCTDEKPEFPPSQ
jgi:hypothetical protein